MKIKILHWNIWFQEKVENIIKLVKEIEPDILCFQELTIGSSFNENLDVPMTISKAMNFEYNFAEAQKFDNNFIQGNGIFSRFPIIKNFNFFIADSTGAHDYSSEGRSCAVSKIKLNTKKEITIATAHCSYIHKFTESEAKLKEVDRLVSFFNGHKEKLIFTGDLNVVPGSKSIKLIEDKLVHAGPNYNEPTWTTKPFSYNGFEEKELKWRLDYVFSSSDINIIDSKIVKTEYSDHLPILLEIEV